MVFSISPSVTIKEVDLTSVIPAIATPPAAIAGVFHWGPIGERVLISSENDLAYTFGKPSDFNAETFFTAADFLSYSNALYVVRVAENANTASTDYFEAKFPGALGNELSVAYVSTPSNGETSNFQIDLFDTDEILDASIIFNSNQIRVDYPSDVNEDIDNLKVGDIISIGNDNIGFQNLRVSAFDISTEVDANTSVETFIHTITFTSKYTLPETNIQNLIIRRLWAFAGAVADAPSAGMIHILVLDHTGTITGTPGQILEKYENVSASPSAKLSDGTNNFYKSVLEQRSNWIKGSDDTINVATENRELQSLSGGADGSNENSVGLGILAAGYDLFKEANEVDVSFILQGKANNTNLPNYITSNIVDFRRDCTAFFSPRKQDVVDVSNSQSQMNNVIAFRTELQNSSYWFMDTGYKYRYDKYNDVYRWVPLNGDMAGLASRVEPWESPAGYRKGILKNVVKLAFNPNKTQRDQLYGKDINPVMTQIGQGTLLFGDKTGLGTATGSAFTRLNVRRLFITVEKAIATIAAQFLFEFNDEFTQAQFKNIVDPFLRDIQGRRGIIDFRVVSDGTINTPDVIDRNIFRSNIFIKPARSINFIELTFVATRTGVSFEELIGQQF